MLAHVTVTPDHGFFAGICFLHDAVAGASGPAASCRRRYAKQAQNDFALVIISRGCIVQNIIVSTSTCGQQYIMLGVAGTGQTVSLCSSSSFITPNSAPSSSNHLTTTRWANASLEQHKLLSFESTIAQQLSSEFGDWTVGSVPVCSWTGVQCEAGLVIGLNLSGISLNCEPLPSLAPSAVLHDHVVVHIYARNCSLHCQCEAGSCKTNSGVLTCCVIFGNSIHIFQDQGVG